MLNKALEWLLESRVPLTVQARFGGEGLVFLDSQDPASYPTLFVSFALTGLPARGLSAATAPA